MYKTVIVDDDPFSQETLKDILSHHSKQYEVVGIYSGVQEALQKLPEIEVDLVLLDMELLDGHGFDVLENLAEINFEVIITTMHDSFMLEAIKHSAIDYLLKPILKPDLAAALSRFETKKEKLNQFKKPALHSKFNRLVIPNQNGLILLDIKDIIRLESDGAYTKFFVIDGSSHLVSKNLGLYENRLQQHDFVRVHHKHLINLNHVINYTKGDGGFITMSDSSSVEVSRRKKEQFLQKLGME